MQVLLERRQRLSFKRFHCSSIYMVPLKEVFVTDAKEGISIYAGMLPDGIVYGDIFDEKTMEKAFVVLSPAGSRTSAAAGGLQT